MMMQNKPFPPVRRILTGHNSQGRSMISSDEKFAGVTVAPGADIILLWTTATVPADNNDMTDGRERGIDLTKNKGSVVRIVDFLPGTESPMHRTDTIDYGIVTAGEIELELEDGVKTIAGLHSVVVQRGTSHKWRNVSQTEPARVIFVLVEAAAYMHEGQPLPAEGL